MSNISDLGLQRASESAIMRARARPRTLAPPCLLPLTKSGGEETRGRSCAWVVEYMCIYEPGHIRCRVRFRTRCRFRPEPSLRFGLGSLNPGSKAGQAPPVASARGPSPARCPRDGRCGAGAPVAHAASGVLGPRRRGFPRVAVSRLAPLRCARSTRPPLGPLGDLRLRRRSVSRAFSAQPRAPLRAPSCQGYALAHPSEAV